MRDVIGTAIVIALLLWLGISIGLKREQKGPKQ